MSSKQAANPAQQIDDMPEGWEIIPDPEIAGQHIALNTTHDGRRLAIVQNEEGRPEISVLVDFALIPPSWAEGDQYDYEGEVVGTFPDLDAAIELANSLCEIPVDED